MFQPRNILITGCSANGIGASLAISLASKGHNIFATARNLAKIPEVLASCTNVTLIQLDVTSNESIAETVKLLENCELDILINNAGMGYTMPLLDVDIQRAQDLYNTNVWGVIRTTQAFAPSLISSGGKVVNISSVGAVTNTPWIGIYTSSKSAITVISETLRLELAPLGVDVLTVMVGTITTPFHSNSVVFQLPSSSYFSNAKETIAQWATGHASPAGCEVQKFADSLVNDIMGKTGLIWRGPYGGTLWFASKWWPQWLLDYFLRSDQGLDQVGRAREYSI